MAIQSLNRSELLALLAAAKRKRERDWLMILVAFNHGLRATEVVGGWLTVKKKEGDAPATKEKRWYPGLTPRSFEDGHLNVQRLKGSLKTIQRLHADTEPLLDEATAFNNFLRGKQLDERLFPVTRERFWQIVQEHAAEAGIPRHKRHPHVLKHSIAMQTIHKAGIENVRQHLGHKSISSTGEYLKVNDDAATSAVERALREGT